MKQITVYPRNGDEFKSCSVCGVNTKGVGAFSIGELIYEIEMGKDVDEASVCISLCECHLLELKDFLNDMVRVK